MWYVLRSRLMCGLLSIFFVYVSNLFKVGAAINLAWLVCVWNDATQVFESLTQWRNLSSIQLVNLQTIDTYNVHWHGWIWPLNWWTQHGELVEAYCGVVAWSSGTRLHSSHALLVHFRWFVLCGAVGMWSCWLFEMWCLKCCFH